MSNVGNVSPVPGWTAAPFRSQSKQPSAISSTRPGQPDCSGRGGDNDTHEVGQLRSS